MWVERLEPGCRGSGGLVVNVDESAEPEWLAQSLVPMKNGNDLTRMNDDHDDDADWLRRH